jgi:hypothetical protein
MEPYFFFLEKKKSIKFKIIWQTHDKQKNITNMHKKEEEVFQINNSHSISLSLCEYFSSLSLNIFQITRNLTWIPFYDYDDHSFICGGIYI